MSKFIKRFEIVRFVNKIFVVECKEGVFYSVSRIVMFLKEVVI